MTITSLFPKLDQGFIFVDYEYTSPQGEEFGGRTKIITSEPLEKEEIRAQLIQENISALQAEIDYWNSLL